MKMAICCATMKTEFPEDLKTFANSITGDIPPIYLQFNTPENNLGVVGSYQKLYVESTEDILCYLHDDVICREEGWNERVMDEFKDERVGLVGFGGALRHGEPALYRVPYQLQQLKRSYYRSNVDDAEVHGERFTGNCNVCVLDGFALILRRSLLDRIGGWSYMVGRCDFYCYDYTICALARQFGYLVRMVGIRCHHRGGGTSVDGKAKGSFITSPEAYEASHRWFYESFRDVMPCLVNP